MREKEKGAILLIIGFYLCFGNTILSIYFFRVIPPCIPTPTGTYCVPLDPATYFQIWLEQYGRYTIAIAIVGLALIIYGSRYFVIKKE